MIGAIEKNFNMVVKMRLDTRVLASEMILASGLLLSAAVSETLLLESSNSLLQEIILWGSSALGFVLGVIALNISRREGRLAGLMPWVLDLHHELIEMEYPLRAESLYPVGEAIAALLPEQDGWIMLVKVPGVLIRGENLRGRFLRVLSDPEATGDWVSSAESVLRDRLEGEGGESKFNAPVGISRAGMMLRVGTSTAEDGDTAIGIAIAAPADAAKGERWSSDVVETALTMAAEHLGRMFKDVLRWRSRINRGGAHDPLHLVRALVHELSGELSGSIIHLERSLEGKGNDHSKLEGKIRRSVMRSSYWVDLLRDVPLFRDEFLAIERGNVRLRTVLIDVIDDVRPAWPDCVFHLSMEEELTVLADRHLRSIMRNLLYNAASYSPIGGTVSIEVTQVGKFARVFVVDQGPGVSAARMKTVFNPYQSESYADDRVESRSAQGMGIGLSVARIIARAYGGDIRCHPKPPARGGRFEVILPLVGVREYKEVGDHA